MGSPLEGHQSGRASLESAEGERVEPEVTAAEEVTTAEAKEGEEGEGGGGHRLRIVSPRSILLPLWQALFASMSSHPRNVLPLHQVDKCQGRSRPFEL